MRAIYSKSAQQQFSSESLCLALDFYSILLGKPQQVSVLVSMVKCMQMVYKCSISEISMKQQESELLHTDMQPLTTRCL